MIALALAVLFTVVPGFTSPSGNIKCAATATELHCEIAHSAYAAKLQNRCLSPNGEMGAGTDWHGFVLRANGKAQLNCAGGTWLTGSQHPRYPRLAYGVPWRAGPFSCVVRLTGVTCVNGHGHGVFVSRQSYRLF